MYLVASYLELLPFKSTSKWILNATRYKIVLAVKCYMRGLLTGIAGMALAKIVRGGGRGGLEASTVLTVVVGTRTGLRIQHSCRGCSLAVPTRKVRRALTLVIIYAVDASSTVLQRRGTQNSKDKEK